MVNIREPKKIEVFRHSDDRGFLQKPIAAKNIVIF